MSLKNHVKSIGILALALTLLCSTLLMPNILGFRSGQSPGLADYAILEGVAGNDYYDSMQYSYKINQWAYDNLDQREFYPDDVYYTANKSLRIGETEYGEFATPENAGIAYGANATEWHDTESWAADQVPAKDWIQGWVLYINYTRQTKQRCLLAWGIYGDFVSAEAGRRAVTWKGLYNPDEVEAELTNGTLIPSGIKVLYDSARLVVARASVTVHDNVYSEDVCKLTFTLVFNKATKYAIVFKDYKTLIDVKVLDKIDDFAFSERYELDLARAANPTNAAYVHYYHDYSDTVYQHPLTGESKYDVLQAFDPARQYVFFAGYWPNATEYSMYSSLVPDPEGGDTSVLPWSLARPDIPPPPVGPNEPGTPWVIVQWRYNTTTFPKVLQWLGKTGGGGANNRREMRFVEVIGMTDYNADEPYPPMDFAAGDGADHLGTEVYYLLDNGVFNPEDLTTVKFVNGEPFMWVGLGQSAATTDSAGAGLLSHLSEEWYKAPFMMFDRNDTLFPWTWSGGYGMKGTIPFGLTYWGGNYYEQFSNSGKGTGTDTTQYKRTGLNGFAFTYDDDIDSPPQPIAGGWDNDTDLWYPSKDPLTERWSYSPWSMIGYDNVRWDPNGIISLGGTKANGLSRYFNDFNYAISREGTGTYALINGGTVTGSAPTSDFSKSTIDYFPISTWNTSTTTFGYAQGFAVISLARDINGTRGLSVYGWDGRDTFWAAAWASQYLGPIEEDKHWIPAGTVALILGIDYSGGSKEPTSFNIYRALGTITELGTDEFFTTLGFDASKPTSWSGDYHLLLPEYPTIPDDGTSNVWWYEKLYTGTTAKVEFDG